MVDILSLLDQTANHMTSSILPLTAETKKEFRPEGKLSTILIIILILDKIFSSRSVALINNSTFSENDATSFFWILLTRFETKQPGDFIIHGKIRSHGHGNYVYTLLRIHGTTDHYNWVRWQQFYKMIRWKATNACHPQSLNDPDLFINPFNEMASKPTMHTKENEVTLLNHEDRCIQKFRKFLHHLWQRCGTLRQTWAFYSDDSSGIFISSSLSYHDSRSGNWACKSPSQKRRRVALHLWSL